jgi:hypothetical protein
MRIVRYEIFFLSKFRSLIAVFSSGSFNPIPSKYSGDLRTLIASMLRREPR